MRIVNLEEFRALPPGVVFMKFDPMIFGDLRIKGETWKSDFLYLSVTDGIDAEDFGESVGTICKGEKIKKRKVFLGGTCNESRWRNELIAMLQIDYFNPVVEDWTPDCMGEEIKQREECDFCLYVITPKMKGVYSIAEAVDDSNKRPTKTIFCLLIKDDDLCFDEFQLRSLSQAGSMIQRNGGVVLGSLVEVAFYLNAKELDLFPTKY